MGFDTAKDDTPVGAFTIMVRPRANVMETDRVMKVMMMSIVLCALMDDWSFRCWLVQ